jgi:hypothetical protein
MVEIICLDYNLYEFRCARDKRIGGLFAVRKMSHRPEPEETPLCYTFTGGGGYVNATLCFEEGKTRINLVTQEWELQVRDFASKMK